MRPIQIIQTISEDRNRALHLMEITLRPDFIKRMDKLCEDWQIEYDMEDKKRHELMESRELRDSVSEILKELNIPISFDDLVHQYLLFGFPCQISDVLPDPDGLIIKTTDKNAKIIVEIGQKTTKEDYSKAWDIIKDCRLTPSRKKERPNFWRNYEIYKLAREGKAIDEIYNFLKSEFGCDLDYGTIKKNLSSFCDRLKIPKKDRPKLVTSKP